MSSCWKRMSKIKSTTEDKIQREKELKELRAVAQAVVDMVDPQEEGVVDIQTLLDRFRDAPQKVTSFV